MLTALDVIAPNGPVDGGLYPETASNVFTARVQGYMDKAYADERIAAQTDAVRRDNLARAYTLATVYDDVVSRMSTQPLTVTITDKGSSGFSAEQIKSVRDIAAKYWADFNGLLIVAPNAPPTQFPGTRAVRVEVEW